MRTGRLVGAVFTAVVVLVVIVGAGTASATRICPTNESTCSSPNPAGTRYTASLKPGTESTISAGFSTFKCRMSSLGFEQTDAGGGAGTPVAGTVTSFSLGECGTLMVNVLSLGSGGVAWTSGVSGSLTGSGTNVEFHIGTTKCFYGWYITEGFIVTGGSPATIKATNVALRRETGSSALCANPARWNAEYVFGQTAYVSQS